MDDGGLVAGQGEKGNADPGRLRKTINDRHEDNCKAGGGEWIAQDSHDVDLSE